MSHLPHDFALRQKGTFHNPGFANIFDATYHSPNLTSQTPFLQGFSAQHFEPPVLKPWSPKNFVHPLFPRESQDNPHFREKYGLPAHKPSLWFDQSAYTSYPVHPSNPEM